MTISAEAELDETTLCELELCRRLPDRRFEKHIWVKVKGGEVRTLMKLRVAQRKILNVIRYLRAKELPVRIIIGKSRKQGGTTIIAADCFEQVKEREIDALILAHEKKTTSKIFEIYSRIYTKYDLPKPPLFKNLSNVKQMRFENHDGKIDIETANNKYAGTALTPQYIHCSEGSKWENGSETLVSLNQCIGDEPGTTLIHESTFNGEEKTFLPIWQAAYENSKLTFGSNYEVTFEVTNQDKWNGYVPIFISVLDDEDAYQEFITEDQRSAFMQTLDAYEKALLERTAGTQSPATPEFLKWRRWAIKHKCGDELNVFKQEYPTTPEEAIRVSGNPRFNIEKLDAMPIEEGQRGFLRRSEKWDRKIEFVLDAGEDLYVHRRPIPGHRYAIGTDVAEGLTDEESNNPDDSVGIVLDLDHGGEQVAVIKGRLSEEHLVEPLMILGEWYNDAWLVTESNSTGQHVCVQSGKLYKRKDRLYHRDDWDPEKKRHNRAIGHRTHSGNRRLLIGGLANAVEENFVLIHDKDTRKQMRSFVLVGGRYEAAKKKHDDHVMALGLAVIGMQSYPVDRASQILSPQYRKRLAEARATADPICGY